MFAVLAAATLAAAQPAEVRPDFDASHGRSRVLAYGAAACPSAGRIYANLAEPALLFREQDRRHAQMKKLIDLPPGRLCLTGGPEPQRRATR